MRWVVIWLLVAACQQDAAPPPAPPKKLELVDAPGGGEIPAIVVEELANATRDHKQLLVYEGATWCEPCREFHEAAAAGRLDATFGDLRLLVFDADRDGEALAQAGYKSDLIPLFAVPGADGRATGRHIEGAVKGAGAVEHIKPRLRALLDGK